MTRPADVVVVAFHRPEPLRRSVPALLAAGLGVVVVNVEEDPDVARVAADAGAVEVPLPANLGFAAAVNAGVTAVTAPVVVFMNDDLEVDALGLVRLVDLVATGTCSVVVPAVRNGSGQLEPTIAALPSPGRLLLEWTLTPDHRPAGMPGLGIEKWRTPAARERILSASATIVACRRDLLVEVPLPVAYFLYWEESEWFWHLHRKGVDLWYEPAVAVRHGGGRDDLRPAKAALLARNAVRCVRRTQGRAAGAAAWPVVVLWSARLLVTALARAARHPSPATRHVARVRVAGLVAACRAVGELA